MKRIYLLAFAALGLAACDNTDTPAPPAGTLKISATIGESAPSRAVDQSWYEGDEIGITSTVGSVVRPYKNVKYTYTTESEDYNFKGTPLFFYSPMTLTAYYPFTGAEGALPGNNGIIEANTRPENQKPELQTKIDFLWDSKTGVDKQDFSATEPHVNFVFSHKMSKVTFTFQSSPETVVNNIVVAGPVDVGDMVNYTLKGLSLDGTFNTATGVCATTGSVSDLAIDMTKGTVEDNNSVLPLILFPQTLADGSAELHIYTDELNDPAHLQHYNCKLNFSNGEIKAGYNYKYTIKVTKNGLIIGNLTVEQWFEESRFIVATIDGEKIFEEQK